MCLYRRVLYVKLLVCRYIFFYLCFVSDVAQLLPNLLKNLRLVLLMKDLLIKKPVNSNLNADQGKFLANKTVRYVLELYVKNNIQNNSSPKPNYKIVY